MGGGSAGGRASSSSSYSAKDYPLQYFCASALAASINYPLWRAAAIGQSGFRVSAMEIAGHRITNAALTPYLYAFTPPYKGMVATISGMTWARAAIFYGSDVGNEYMKKQQHNWWNNEDGTSTSNKNNLASSFASILPPLVVCTIVQIINMPLVRATITIQDPKSNLTSVSSAVRYIYHKHGIEGLWHGTSAGILKAVPKYCTAVIVKDIMEEKLPKPDRCNPNYAQERLIRSACKSVAAGLAGAALTNPIDCIRNEMFKTNMGLLDTVRYLNNQSHHQLGYSWAARGLGKNLIAVSIPVAFTIFFCDVFIQFSQSQQSQSQSQSLTAMNAFTTTTTTTTTASSSRPPRQREEEERGAQSS